MARWQIHIIGTSPDDDGNVVQDVEARIRDFIATLDRGDVSSVLLTMDAGSDVEVMVLQPTADGPRFAEADEQLRPVP